MLATSFTAESASPPKEREAYPGVQEKFWTWVADGKEYRIRYQTSGTSGPAILMVHGFGGNCDHFRKNTPVLGEWGQAYAIDLLGYGYSDKPDPRQLPKNSIYNFECWARQLQAFIQEVIQQPTFVVCNSIGGLPGLLVAQYLPDQVLGVQLLDVSLRKLHVKNQSPLARPLIAAFQDALRTTPLGRSFFDSVAQAKTVKNILQQAYCDPNTVTDELVSLILQPGLQPGAADVFLDFISYSGGPLPADAIAQCPVPVSMLWGAEDPWEKIEWGRELAQIPQVEEFVTIPGVGHCPQDEAPQLVNPLIRQFVMRHADQ